MFPRALAAAALLAASIASAQVAATAAPKGDSLPLYRLRLLGVYDSETSEAVSSAEVTDLKSGASGTTNRSGLVSLHFLPVGGALVRIRKVGYTPVTLFVTISPTDTAPLTEVLTRSVRTLPVVTTRDSTVKWVSPGLRGFEERTHMRIKMG